MKTQCKRTLLFILIVISAIVIINLVGWSVFFMFYKPQPNLAVGNDWEYYNRIKELSEKQDIIDLNDVFTFKWDKAYLIASPRIAGKELEDIIGIKNDLEPIDPHSAVLRIVFIRENKIVKVFMYDTNYLTFEPMSTFVLSSKSEYKVEKGRLIKLKYV